MKVLLRSMVSVRAAEHLAVVELHRVRVLSRVGRSVFLFPLAFLKPFLSTQEVVAIPSLEYTTGRPSLLADLHKASVQK